MSTSAGKRAAPGGRASRSVDTVCDDAWVHRQSLPREQGVGLSTASDKEGEAEARGRRCETVVSLCGQ